MRKVLFATTALVALGGVSAASADISVSAANEFQYKSWSDSTTSTTNDSSMTVKHTYKISASAVLDNGMTLSSYLSTDGTDNFADDGFSIAGDFGTIGFGGSESGDAFATAADVTPDEAWSYTTATWTAAANAFVMPADESVEASTVSYLSPDINGFQFALGVTDTAGYNDTSSMGAQYKMTSGDTTVTIKYASSEKGVATSGAVPIEAQSLGLVFAYGDTTVTLAQNKKEKGTSYDYTGDAVGISHKMSDSLTISAYTGTTEDGQDSTHEISDTGLGLAYTITPGLTLSVTHNDWDMKDASATNENGEHTTVALDLSF
jgi:hypothetical protein